MRLQIILIYKKPFSLTLSSVTPLYTLDTSVIIYTSFSIYSDTYRFFFSISTNILDNFTSSFNLPSHKKLHSVWSTILLQDRLRVQRVFVVCRWRRCLVAQHGWFVWVRMSFCLSFWTWGGRMISRICWFWIWFTNGKRQSCSRTA